MDITEQEFKAYVRVQESGVTNMLDVKLVSELSGLSEETIMEIIKNYGTLSNIFEEGISE